MGTEMRAEGLTTGTHVQKGEDGTQQPCGDAPVVGQLKEGSRKDWIPLLRPGGVKEEDFMKLGLKRVLVCTCTSFVMPALV